MGEDEEVMIMELCLVFEILDNGGGERERQRDYYS